MVECLEVGMVAHSTPMSIVGVDQVWLLVRILT